MARRISTWWSVGITVVVLLQSNFPMRSLYPPLPVALATESVLLNITDTPLLAPTADEIWVTPTRGSVLSSGDGRIELGIPSGAVSSRTRFSYTPNPSEPETPDDQIATFVLSAQTETGQPVTRTLRPVVLAVRYTRAEIADLTRVRPAVTWWQSAWSAWLRLPGTVEDDRLRVVLQTSDLGVFGLTAADDDEGKVTGILGPSVLGAGPDLWTGDAGFSYPLALPPGPGGLTPGLSLSYSGGSVNDMLRQVGPTQHDV